MKRIHDNVKAVHLRRQRQWIWQCLSAGLVFGGIAGCLFGVARLASAGSLPLGWIAASLLIGPILGLVYSLLRPCRIQDAAFEIDHRCGLKDRVATALSFMDQNADSPIHQLQIKDAEERVASVEPVQVAPYAAPRSWVPGLGLSFVAVVLAFFSGPAKPVFATVVTNNVVATQAMRVENSLEELKEYNEKELDPEIKKLLQELAEKIEELKQPGMDPKEALAKLSEMEASLHEQQEQLKQQNIEATLQEVGKAISLAEPLEAAGQAMSEGKMDKAAEELAKLELPELDQKTEKALKEKLAKISENSKDGAPKQLKNAITQFSEGLCQGDRSKFKDGVEGLAGQCKKQGNRKKLSDLLRKQCQCLCECKGECESECKSGGQNKGKGGKNWGLAASGNEAGDKTAKLKTGPQMQITGKESDSGDVDVETIKSNEQEQDAVRQYRESSDKYEQLTESVLSSEPIPLGHRQTIRRYFEMIRPQDGETDKVNEATDAASGDRSN